MKYVFSLFVMISLVLGILAVVNLFFMGIPRASEILGGIAVVALAVGIALVAGSAVSNRRQLKGKARSAKTGVNQA